MERSAIRDRRSRIALHSMRGYEAFPTFAFNA
jgi:hypothetical protein